MDPVAPRPLAAPAPPRGGGAPVLLRTTPDAALDRTEALLRSGTVVPESVRTLGNAGANGPVTAATLVNPADPSQRIDVVLKLPRAQAAEEEFGYHVARALGIDYLFPKAARRADGTTAVELVPGTELREQGITNGAGVLRVLEGYYRRNHPELSPAAAAQAARTDQQLLQFYDYLVANIDRKPANAMADARTGALHWIDQGNIGVGETSDVFRPRLDHYYQETAGQTRFGAASVQLDPQVVAIIRDRLTEPRLRAAHEVLRQPTGEMSTLHVYDHARAADDRFLGNMLARRDYAVAHGGYEFNAVADRTSAPFRIARTAAAILHL